MRILTCSVCQAPVRHVTADEAAVLALSDGDLPDVTSDCVWHAGVDWAVLARLLDCETTAPVLTDAALHHLAAYAADDDRRPAP